MAPVKTNSKAARAQKKQAGKEPVKETPASSASLSKKFDDLALSDTTVTGVLTSHPTSRDIRIESLTLSYHGKELLSDTALELNFGRRYGLIGPNGSGKSTLLKCIAARDIPVPEHIDIFHLSEESAPSESTAIRAVIEKVEREYERLEQQSEDILTEEGPDSEALQDIYDRLDEMDPTTFESRAAELLFGLGFSTEMMNKKTKDLSGGWRMRVALAEALFVKPTLLLLDEPTNHLDLEACVWLEECLKKYNRILVIVSHSQDFLNGVCTNIINLRQSKLFYYSGNYDTFVKVKSENEQNQMKQYYKQQEEIKHMKEFIASCGTYSNLVRQGKSRQKILDKMEADGLIEKVVEDKPFTFRFASCGKLPPPVLSFDDVAFAYSGNKKDALYKNLNLAVDLDSRIALVGPNGAGKSTLLKLMRGDLEPTEGRVGRHMSMRMGVYNQHSAEQLDLDATPLDYIKSKFPDIKMDDELWRARIGQYGITGSLQTTLIGKLSDGLKSRVVFAQLAIAQPHMLLLDEPTNHLDMECIDSLAEALNGYEGGLVLVSHDFRLINQVVKDIWICDKKEVTPWKGSIQSYKQKLRSGMKI